MTKPNWSAIEIKLRREKKETLIELIKELTAVSPEAQRFVQTRYQQTKILTAQIAPYRDTIQAQFVISDWHNAISWDFDSIQKAIDNYATSSQDNKDGICALLVIALEAAMNFADNFTLQDASFDAGVTELAEQCATQLMASSQRYQQYARRLSKVKRVASQLGYVEMVEALDEITQSF